MKKEDLAALRAAVENWAPGYGFVIEKHEILLLLDHIAKLEAERDGDPYGVLHSTHRRTCRRAP